MIPHFSTRHQCCEHCGDDILIGYEAILTKDGYFCEEDCLKNHLYESEYKKEIYLTAEKIYREVD